MNLSELIHIARNSFPSRVHDQINWENLSMIEMGDVYRLYDKNEDFIFMLPKKDILVVFIYENFVQIDPGNMPFNHYKAIQIMEEIGLIKRNDSK